MIYINITVWEWLMLFALVMVYLCIHQLSITFVSILTAIINQLNWPIYVPPL